MFRSLQPDPPMRVTPQQLARVHAAYVLIADVLGVDEAVLFVTGDRQSYAGMLADLTSRQDVLQVRSYRLAQMEIAEDFGTMAGYYWSGDEFALDGRGEDE